MKLTIQTTNKIQKYPTENSEQPFRSILKSINKTLDFLYPNGNCLIKSLVKRDFLKKYGYLEHIAVGVISTECGIKAHAWLSRDCESEYNIVHLL